MTLPLEYAHASAVFDRFFGELREEFGHDSRHETYLILDAVLKEFRRRLTVTQALVFAGALPAVVRAMFVRGWDPGECAGASDTDRDNLPEGAETVARVLRRHVDVVSFDQTLALLPNDAADLWRDKRGTRRDALLPRDLHTANAAMQIALSSG